MLTKYQSFSLKEPSFCHKLWFYNRHIFSTWWWCKPLIFLTILIWSKMKYLRFPTFKWKDKWIIKSEFLTKTQFLCWCFSITNSTMNRYIDTSFLEPVIKMLFETALLTCRMITRKLWDRKSTLKLWLLILQ